MDLTPHYVSDSEGRYVAVQLTWADWQALQELLLAAPAAELLRSVRQVQAGQTRPLAELIDELRDSDDEGI